MMLKTIFALALAATMAGPAFAHGKGKAHDKSQARMKSRDLQADFPSGWTVRREGDRLIAERSVERVSGQERGAPSSALRLAVRAAVVNNAILDADRISQRIDEGEVTLQGRFQDRETALRTMQAIAEIPQIDRVEHRGGSR